MARLARIYQLTEIEMSVTGVLLKFCVVAVLIYTWRKMGSSWLIVTEPRQQIYQPLCLLLIRRTWSQKDKGASMHLFSPHQMPFRLHQRCCGACLSVSVCILKTPSFIMSQVLIWTAAGSVFFRESEAQGICSECWDGFRSCLYLPAGLIGH